jgi:hypothetical protein
VIATDRQVTHGAMGNTTIGQAGTKAAIIRKGAALYASSGAVGIGQQICAGIDALDVKFHGRQCVAVVPDIQKEARAVIIPAFEVAQKSVAVIGHPATQQDAICTGLLAAKFSDGIKLVELSPQGGCEILTIQSVPFVCQGSGKGNADPFLRFLWDVYWSKGTAPSLKEAVLAGYWTVKVVTQLRTSGVGCGVEVYTLRDQGTAAVAEKIPDSALGEHDEFIAAVEDAMRGVRDQMMGKVQAPGTPPPPVPTPEATRP